MKTIAALIAGLLLSLTTFVAGLAIALTLLNADEPEHRLAAQDTEALWTTQPVAVDKKSQPFERIPKRIAVEETKGTHLKLAGAGAKAIKTVAPPKRSATDTALIDPTITGAIDDQAAKPEPAAETWRSTAHADWCSRRYRSYNAQNNTYRPYGGGRRACQSPYANATTTVTNEAGESDVVMTPATEEQPVERKRPQPMEQVAYEDASDAYVDGDHVQSCFERYRSYRPEDNSYQPFDGGPRRQCQ